MLNVLLYCIGKNTLNDLDENKISLIKTDKTVIFVSTEHRDVLASIIVSLLILAHVQLRCYVDILG